MSGRQTTKVTRSLRRSPDEIGRAIRAFSANARSFPFSKEEAIAQYKDKWIAIHRGVVAAVADTLEELAIAVEAKKLSANEISYHHIDSQEKIFIL
jgi:hypothetical protein